MLPKLKDKGPQIYRLASLPYIINPKKFIYVQCKMYNFRFYHTKPPITTCTSNKKNCYKIKPQIFVWLENLIIHFYCFLFACKIFKIWKLFHFLWFIIDLIIELGNSRIWGNLSLFFTRIFDEISINGIFDEKRDYFYRFYSKISYLWVGVNGNVWKVKVEWLYLAVWSCWISWNNLEGYRGSTTQEIWLLMAVFTQTLDIIKQQTQYVENRQIHLPSKKQHWKMAKIP